MIHKALSLRDNVVHLWNDKLIFGNIKRKAQKHPIHTVDVIIRHGMLMVLQKKLKICDVEFHGESENQIKFWIAFLFILISNMLFSSLLTISGYLFARSASFPDVTYN